MKHVLALALTASTMASAHAAVTFMTVDLQAFDTSDSTWKDAVTVAAGTTVQMRMLATFGVATGTADAFAMANIRLINLDGSFAGDNVSLSWTGKLTPSTQTFKIYNPGLPTGTIDRADNQAQNLQFGQVPSGLGGNTSNPLLIASFSYSTDAVNDAVRDIGMFLALPADFVTSTIYTNPGGTTVITPPANRTFDGATIHVTPAPATLLGLGGLLITRRRRA